MSYQTCNVDYVNYNSSEADKIILNGTVVFRSHKIMERVSFEGFYLDDPESGEGPKSGFTVANSNPFPIFFVWYISPDTVNGITVGASSSEHVTLRTGLPSTGSDTVFTYSSTVHGTALFSDEGSGSTLSSSYYTNYSNAQGYFSLSVSHTRGTFYTTVSSSTLLTTVPILTSGKSTEVTTMGDRGELGTYTWHCYAQNSSVHQVHIYVGSSAYDLGYYATLAASSGAYVYLYNNDDSSGTLYVRFVTTDMNYGNVSALASIGI